MHKVSILLTNLGQDSSILVKSSVYVHPPKVKVKSLSRVRLFATLWTEAHKAPPSMGFSRQEYWSGLLFASPGDLPDSGSPALEADSSLLSHLGSPFQRRYRMRAKCRIMRNQSSCLLTARGAQHTQNSRENIKTAAHEQKEPNRSLLLSFPKGHQVLEIT